MTFKHNLLISKLKILTYNLNQLNKIRKTRLKNTWKHKNPTRSKWFKKRYK